MGIINEKLTLDTKGFGDILNVTQKITRIVEKHNIKNGLVYVFVVGATASLTITEFEPGLIRDLSKVIERLIPKNDNYSHNIKWSVNNAHSYILSSIFGAGVGIPIINSIIELGTCQKIVLFDFDTRPRSRRIIIQIIY